MIQKKRMELLQKPARKVIKLSDGRWGIVFENKKRADIFANFLKHSKLNPTKIHQTKYGYAFKYDDVSSLDEKVWPYSLIPPTYDVEKHGVVYVEWDNLEYTNYLPKAQLVYVQEYDRVAGGGIHMKRLNIPYPPVENEKTKKAKSIPVMTTIKPNGWIMSDPVPQYKFTSYIWYLNPESGTWRKKETKGLRPFTKDKIGEFITREVQAGRTSHR